MLDTIGKKIAAGYALMIAIFAMIIGLTIYQLNRTEQVTIRLKNLRVPTALASTELLNGINHSLAALRGWILLGDQKFKEERAIAWRDEIDYAFVSLKRLSKGWTNVHNIERLKFIESQIKNFRNYQREIESVAQTDDNIVAVNILFSEAAPIAKKLVTSITKMIEQEAKLSSSPQRKSALIAMANYRGSIGIQLAAIRAYLIGGDNQYREEYYHQLQLNDASYRELLKHAALFDETQRIDFNELKLFRQKFQTLPEQMFKLRSAVDWNSANYLLSEKAAPIAFTIKTSLSDMIQNQNKLMQDDFNLAEELTDKIFFIELMLIFIAAVLGIIFVRKISSDINRQIKASLNVVDVVAKGNYQVEINIGDSTEMSAISGALKRLIDKLGSIAEIAENFSSGKADKKMAVINDDDILAKAINKIVDSAVLANKEKLNHQWRLNGFLNLVQLSSSERDIKDLSFELCNFLAKQFDAQLVTLYLLRGERLVIEGYYAPVKAKQMGTQINLGEGLVGQVAVNGEQLSVTKVPQDYSHIASSLGDSYPRHIVLQPFMLDKTITGVIELGAFETLNDDKLSLLDSLANVIALKISSIQ